MATLRPDKAEGIGDFLADAAAPAGILAMPAERAAAALRVPSSRPAPEAVPWWLRTVRVPVRLTGVLGMAVVALADYLLRVWLFGGAARAARRAQWLSRWARCSLRLLGVRVACSGAPAESGLLVCNHLGYLDIAVIASVQHCVFVAKSEVRSWPLVGLLSTLAGTLFIRRDSRADVGRLNLEVAREGSRGRVVVIFPEGTSTDGSRVLPFHSALLAPAAERGWFVTPAWVGYSLEDGSVEDEVCYWRDMTFLPHFLNLLSKGPVDARLVFGDPLLANLDRKRLARDVHDRVVALGRGGVAGPPRHPQSSTSRGRGA